LCVFAEAFEKFGDSVKTAELYRRAIEHPDAEAPLYGVQKLANFLDRRAKKLNAEAAQTEDGEKKEKLRREAAGMIDEAIKWLKWMEPLGETAERWSLLGGAYRRKALFDERDDNLRMALECYWKAHDLALKKTGEIDTYPALNWLSLRFLTGESTETIEPDLAQSTKAAFEQSRVKNDFWSQIGLQDALLIEAMIRGTIEQEQDKISRAYVSILRDTTNEAHFDSVYGGVSDMRDLVKDGAMREILSRIAAAIKRTRDLEGDEGRSTPGTRQMAASG
jgi:hypothetical protein